MYKKMAVGKYGEDLACKYLEKNNYNILDRNFSCMQGEIDIIAYDKKSKEIAFIEVKSRTNFNYGFPSEAVDKRKQKHILNSARYYMYVKRLDNTFVRIDVIEIVFHNEQYKLNHIKNAL